MNTNDVVAAIGGDLGAFGNLCEKYRSHIFNFFMRRTYCDSNLSEDLTQDTFVVAQQKIYMLNNPDRFLGWLHTTAHRLFIDSCRQKKKIVTEEFFENKHLCKYKKAQKYIDVFEINLSKYARDGSQRYDNLLKMYYKEGMSGEQIAEKLNIKIRTLWVLLFRAKAAMKKELNIQGFRTLEDCECLE